MPFAPSRRETWAPIRPFPPSDTDGTIPLPPVGTPAPSFGSSNPFADDLGCYLAPLQRQTIHEYMPGGPPGGGPPGVESRQMEEWVALAHRVGARQVEARQVDGGMDIMEDP